MPFITPRGSKSSRIWVICERPYPSDIPKGYMFSGGMGFVFEKMCREAGLNINDMHITSRRPDTDSPKDFYVPDGDLNTHKPPIILVMNETGAQYLSELKDKDGEHAKGKLQANAGSLLQSKSLSYPHYMVPIYGPDRCIADWAERNVTTYIDLQKVRGELEYWKQHSTLQPLLERKMYYHDMPADELFHHLDAFMSYPYIANDIENPIYRTEMYKPHPGYPFLMGLACSSTYGISFKMFRDSPSENRELWRKLDKLFRNCITIGQNFFNYDSLFENAVGFELPLDKIQDTLIRHHILWPELSHKLQFMTRQYTREPYYKAEGQSWGLRLMDRYRRYNCLDACVTFEVFEGQEEEFKQRPHLR